MKATLAQVFKNFEREDLLHIIKYRGIEGMGKLAEHSNRDLVKILVDHVSATGLQLMFETLGKETLTSLTTDLEIQYPGYEEGAKPSYRLMAKHLVVAAEAAPSFKHFLTHQCANHVPAILKDLELDEEVSAEEKEKAAKAILAEAGSIGTENCLSAFSVDILIRFAKGSGLQTYGGSREKILTALMERTDMKKPVIVKKKKQTEEQSAETKPRIAKGISRVDLNSWYYAADLAEWCKERDLPHNVAKKILIKQILDHLDGKEPPKKPEKVPAEPKKKKKTRTRAPIGQAKRPKRKPKAKKNPEGEETEGETPKKREPGRPKKTKASEPAEGEPPTKKPETVATKSAETDKA